MATKVLDDVERAEFKEKFGLSYQLEALEFFEAQVGLRGKRVLELAGSNLPRELVIDRLGVKHWTCIDDPGGKYLEVQKKRNTKLAKHYNKEKFVLVDEANASLLDLDYLVLLGDAASLPKWMLGKFDLVVSIAGFEHIGNLGAALSGCHGALANGGTLVADFGPLWSSVSGHHLNNFKDKAGNPVDWQRRECPIPPWGHLLLDEPELHAILAESLGEAQAPAAMKMIYQSNAINRYYAQDYFDIFVNSPFKSFEWHKTWTRQPNPDQLRRLRERHPGRTEFSQAGARVVLRK